MGCAKVGQPNCKHHGRMWQAEAPLNIEAFLIIFKIALMREKSGLSLRIYFLMLQHYVKKDRLTS